MPAAVYEANVAAILDALRGRLAAERIVVVAVPDYTVAPAGGDYGDPHQQHAGIVAGNAVITSEPLRRGCELQKIDVDATIEYLPGDPPDEGNLFWKYYCVRETIEATKRVGVNPKRISLLDYLVFSIRYSLDPCNVPPVSW